MNLNMAATTTASSIDATRSFRRFDCGKIQITMEYRNLANCIRSHHLESRQLSLTITSRDERINMGISSGIERRSWTHMGNISGNGRGTYSLSVSRCVTLLCDDVFRRGVVERTMMSGWTEISVVKTARFACVIGFLLMLAACGKVPETDQGLFLEGVMNAIKEQVRNNGCTLGGEGAGNKGFSIAYADGSATGWIDVWGVPGAADNYTLIITITES